ncbi:MAG: PAS domain S-box protein [Tsuneonella sp.]
MQAEDHYKALIQSSDDAIVAKDLEGRVVSWNPAAERLFGWTAEEMIGQSIRRLLPPGCQDEEDRILGLIRAGHKVGLSIADRVHKSGRPLKVAVTISPMRDAEGTIVGASKIARDATERAQIEDRLQDSELRFRMLADNMSQLAWIAEANGDIHWYNRRWYEYTGVAERETDGWDWRKVHHPDHVERVTEHFRHSIENAEAWEDLFPLRSASGEWRWFLSRAQPIRGANGDITNWFGTNTDITDQREQAEQITLLLREVNHRAKNMLAKVQALARSSIGVDPALVKRFEERVGSLAVNQDILVRRDWREVPVEELVRLQLAFVSDARGRVHTSGPDCALTPRAAEVIGMAIHELATNSLKYGALLLAEGRVDVEWECEGSRFRISWREQGGPEVGPPSRRGFGTTLIEDIPRVGLRAEVSLDFVPDGVVWQLVSEDNVLADATRLVA